MAVTLPYNQNPFSTLPILPAVPKTPTPQTQEEINPNLERVENKVRRAIWAMRIRLHDLFSDFDKLRSGYVTAAQFRRCLGSAMDRTMVPLTEVEYQVLVKFYDTKGNGMFKWTSFVDSIDTVFGAKKLEQAPTQYIPSPQEVVKPVRPALSPASESVVFSIIERLKSYVKHHGSDVKSWFKDFDKHNNGFVTENQFRRGIPQNLLSLEEEELLLYRYSDELTGTVNYFKLNTDVNRKVQRPKVNDAQLVAKLNKISAAEHIPVGTEALLIPTDIHNAHQATLDEIEDEIKKHVYKDRIRLVEFFKDYDRHNCGRVTEAQFRAGLRQASILLHGQDVKTLLQQYQEKDGRVQYRKFCNSIDTVFTVSHLETNPLADVQPPPRGYLVKGYNKLSVSEEERCNQIISRFRKIMSTRRLLMAPFFKDFDKYMGCLGRVSRSHFSRLLSTMNLDVSEDDLFILFKKYEDKTNGNINYMEFIRAIDPETYDHFSKPADATPLSEPKTPQQKTAQFTEIFTRLQTYILSQRTRVSEFFRDFDKLRSYSIPRHEFIRGVNRIGVSLTGEELEVIADKYKGSNGFCKWKKFESDIEKVFGENHLENRPSIIPKPAAVETNPFITGVELAEKETRVLNILLKSMREHLRIRQTSIKPFFKDFDKLCTGHVSKTQFRQCLTYMGVYPKEEEFEILCKRWCKKPQNTENKSDRICYLAFLNELDIGIHEHEEAAEKERIEKKEKELFGKVVKAPKVNRVVEVVNEEEQKIHESVRVLTLGKNVPLNNSEVQKLMKRIKTKVKTERIRVIDFMMDFDHLRHGKITRNEFRRVLKVIFTNLTELELITLETLFLSPTDPRFVEYVRFSDTIESVFTMKGLEQAPTAEPVPFTDYCFENGDSLDFETLNESKDQSLNLSVSQTKYQKKPLNNEDILKSVLKRLSEKIRQRRIDVLIYLEDFDFVNEGTITTNQFRSVLNTLNLSVDDDEIMALAKKYAVNRSWDRIAYRAFVADLQKGDSVERGAELGWNDNGKGKHAFELW
ncbi:hypothetical protein HK098_005797 [Nowakowskiella sp. JEL0407]|nr:hypothetical protein HK098_005797 [Nowakowskiella sp. JEL0407]